tara:strand:- start:723 stop:2711 length:1989 start_codon:yes stop_codon:yes gene_type:complete
MTMADIMDGGENPERTIPSDLIFSENEWINLGEYIPSLPRWKPGISLGDLNPETANLVQRMNRIINPGETGQRDGPYGGTDWNSGADVVRDKYGMSPMLPGQRNARTPNPYMSSHGDPNPQYRYNQAFQNPANRDNAYAALGSQINLKAAANAPDASVQGILDNFNIPETVQQFRERFGGTNPDPLSVDEGIAALENNPNRQTPIVGGDFRSPEERKKYEDEQKQIAVDQEIEKIRNKAKEDRDKQDLINEINKDTAEPTTKLNPPIDPNINPLTGQPYDGGINVGGLTPEQLKEYGLSNEAPTQEQIDKAISDNKETTPEEKNALEKATKAVLDKKNKGRLADGKDPQVGSGFWSNIGILTGVAGGIALLENLFKGGSSSKPKGGVAELPGSSTTPVPGSSTTPVPGSTTTPPGSTTTPVPGSVTPGTAKEAYDIALQEGGYDTLSENGKAMAKGHATTLPKGIVPKWLMLLLGLGALLGGNEDSDPTSLQEAAEKRSLEVYGRDDLFDPAGPSPLQQLDPAFKDIKTFMPEGQVPDFNLGYKGVPNQLYANYEGTGPGGVSGPRGVIQEKAYGGLMSLASGGSTSYPRMNGQIAGPGTEKSDDIPAMLSDGEFVVNAAAVRGIGNLMGRKKPKSKVDQRREGARTMYALQKAGEQAARTA